MKITVFNVTRSDFFKRYGQENREKQYKIEIVDIGGYLFQKFIRSFDFLITYGVCKKRKYCNRTSEKKILSFWRMFMICMS